MQLPRGKYRSIKKGAPLGEILDEMITSRVSGICLFSSDAMKVKVFWHLPVLIRCPEWNRCIQERGRCPGKGPEPLW